MNDESPDDTFDATTAVTPRQLLDLIVARRWLVIAVVTVATAVAGVTAFLLTPVYAASVVLAPANTERTSEGLGAALGQLGGIASVVGLNLGGAGRETDEALAILRSRQFTEAFISERNLMPRLFWRKWDAQHSRWNVAPGKEPTLAKAYKYFDKDVRSVIQDKKTGLVTMTIYWKDRSVAADWANELARRLNEEVRTRARQKADLAVGYLDHELQSTTQVVTRDAIGRLMEASVKQRMLANVTQEYAFRVVDRAMPPDKDDPDSPHKLRIIAGGMAGGFALAVLWLFISASLRPRPPEGGI